ncbi:MAG: hypothetical protein HYX68_16695 [Planctomycetes bacterium]|nr:hypothetical protein [Planctomycetota bacterium]
MFFNNPSRRHFLKSTAAAIASLILPRSLFARNPDHFFVIHADPLNSWPVADPVAWALQNQDESILARAAEGLAKLTPNDADRIIRLVVRRCRLNLIELYHGQVVVHHWGPHRADLRPFFKAHRLATNEIKVVLRDRKRETVTTQHGDDFLFGSKVAPDFPVDLFQSKWANRFTIEADDWQAAPGTWSGFGWANTEDNRIPWAAMKSAWRRAAPGTCLNCDTPTILVNFGLRPVGMFNRCLDFVHVCGACRRSFVDDSIKDVAGWMAANLDGEVRPAYEMIWGKRAKRQ